MEPITIQLASLRLAPVQIATWGHPETTGLPTIDYYLSAEDLEPADARDNYTEQLVALPHLGCCYQRLAVTPVAPDLDALAIHADRPIFICAGTPYKYVPHHDWVFTEIARRTERCQFVFSLYNQETLAEALRARLAAAFAAAGMDFRDYGVFLPWQSRPAFYGLLQRADVYLDTIGFSGFNTAMQAIECGLPIVTREGRFLRGRLASGILKRMGLPDLAVPTEEDYVERAVALAGDAPARMRLRDRIEASRPLLFDDIAPIRALETFLVGAARGR
jgi:protein O-GlcNAc transferase